MLKKYLIYLLVSLLLFTPPPLSAQRFIPSDNGHAALQLIKKRLITPVGTAIANDGSNRLFIVEQIGRIKILDLNTNQLLKDPFLDVSHLIPSGEFIATHYEVGLLGLAFHPEYASNRRFFIFYTDKNTNIIIAEYKVRLDNPNKARRRPVKTLFNIPHPDYFNHFGGQLVFGPDGYLYIGVADGGGVGDPFNSGQNLKTLKAKILRIDVNGSTNRRNYLIPGDNPFKHRPGGALPEIYAYGFRNPWRMSFDSLTGELFAADVGQYRKEEIDLVEAGGNYGWNIVEGSVCYGQLDKPPPDCDKDDYLPPIAEYDRPNPIRFGDTAIIGGYVYRGTALPELNGRYFFADFTHGFIDYVKKNSHGDWIKHSFFTGLPFYISSFGVDESGELYVFSYDRGSIYKLVPNV